MSYAYTSHTLNDLIQQSLNKVCEEHDHTVVLKRFLTKLLGDDPWINLAKMEEPETDHSMIAHERGEALFKDYPYGASQNSPKVNGTSSSVNGQLTNGEVDPAEGETDEANNIAMIDVNDTDETSKPGQEQNSHRPDSTVEQEALNKIEVTPSPGYIIPEPRRMTTRSSNNNTHPLPVTSEPSKTDLIDSFFIPPPYNVDRDFGLPPAEAEETRRMLVAAVQRQDEFLRGLNRLRMGLLRAERLRKKVWEWCRTMEGMREYHQRLAETNPAAPPFDIEEGEGVGLSDDEDWYDMQAWKLDQELEKGREEEDEGLEPLPGKKTRGRNR